MQSIIKISEAASIALHSMVYIAGNAGKPANVKEIAKGFDVSGHHLSKVLQRLVKSGLLRSIKGVNGGFILAKSSDQLTFLEIYEAIDGKFPSGSCLFGKQSCDSGNCIMGSLITSVNTQVKEFFEDKKLSDFM